MKKILFICYGNICRSTMAECIFKSLTNEYECDSKATSTEEIGNTIYYLAEQKLKEKGIPVVEHYASQMTKDDYDRYDLIIVMEERNKKDVLRIVGNDYDDKIHLLLDYTNHPDEIDDPWYTRNFEVAYNQIYDGCVSLIKYLDNVK